MTWFDSIQSLGAVAYRQAPSSNLTFTSDAVGVNREYPRFEIP